MRKALFTMLTVMLFIGVAFAVDVTQAFTDAKLARVIAAFEGRGMVRPEVGDPAVAVSDVEWVRRVSAKYIEDFTLGFERDEAEKAARAAAKPLELQ